MYTVYITPGSARFEPACRRLSMHGCGDFGSHTSGTEGWGFGLGVCQQFYIMNFSPGLRGRKQLAGGSLLLAVAAILVRI